MNVYMKSIKRMIAAILCFVMFFDMLPVSAAKDSWKQKDGIRYRVEQTEIENGEEIYVAAEAVRNDVELIGIELPDGQVEYSDGTYAEARFEAYSDGDYDFKILYRKLDLATESDADISTDSEPDRSTPTDPDRDIATVTDAEPYEDEDEDGELIVPDMDIMSDKAITATAMKVQMSSDIPEADDVESIDISVNVNSLNSDVGVSINWQDSSGNKLPDENEVAYADRNKKDYLSLNFSLGGSDIYPAGSVKIVIPGGMRLIQYEDGSYPTMYNARVSVNNKYVNITSKKQTVTGTVMDCYADGEDIILVNNAAIQGGNYSFGTVFYYYFKDNGFYEFLGRIPGETKRDFKAEVYINDELVSSSNLLSYIYKTTPKISNQQSYTTYYKWLDIWGEKPAEYDENYFYVPFTIDPEPALDQRVIIDDIDIDLPSNNNYEGINIIGYNVVSSSFIIKDDIGKTELLPFTGEIESFNADDEIKLLFVAVFKNLRTNSNSDYQARINFTLYGHGEYCDPDEIISYTGYYSPNYYPQTIKDKAGKYFYLRGKENKTGLIELNNNLSATSSYKIEYDATFLNFRKEHGPDMTRIFEFDDDIYLGGIKLNHEDYSLGYKYGMSTGFKIYEEDPVTGRLSLSFIYNLEEAGLVEIFEVKSIENEAWHKIVGDINSSNEHIYALRNTVEGEFDYIYGTDNLTITIYPTEHVLEIIEGKDSVEISTTGEVIIKSVDDEVFSEVTGNAEDGVLSGKLSFAPVIYSDIRNEVINDTSLTANVYVAYMQSYETYFDFLDGINAMNMYLAIPSYVSTSNFKLYYLDENVRKGTVYPTYFKNEVDENYYTISKIGEKNNYNLYSIELNIPEAEYNKKCFEYGIAFDIYCPVEVIKANNIKSFYIKAAWQDPDGENISSGGRLDWNNFSVYQSFDSESNTNNYIQTNDNNLIGVLRTDGSFHSIYQDGDFSEFENIDGNDIPNEIAVNSNNISTNLPETYESNYTITTMGSLDSYYIEDATTEVGSGYRYRLRLSNSATSQRRNIIMYDNLEASQGKNESWKGTFAGVDIQDFIDSYGVTPKVYYSTKTDLPVDTVPSEDELLGPDWSVTCPEDPSEVTALAFDFGDFMLDVKQAMYVDIIMNAPSRISYADDGSNLYAYNESAYYSSGKEDGDESWDSVLTQKANLTRVKLVEPLVNITKTADPGPGTEDAPEMLSPGDTFDYYITVSNNSEFAVNNITYTDSIDDRLEFNEDDIRVKLNSSNYSNLITENIEVLENCLTITIPSLRRNDTLTFKIPVYVPDNMENGEITNTAYLTSVNGKDVNVQSETTYHMVDDKSFIAGRGMRVFFDVLSTGRSSIFEQTSIAVNGIPEGTELELYRMEDCEITDKGWYVPKSDAKSIGTYNVSEDSVTLDANPLDGSQDDISNGKTVHHDYILYCSKGSMRDTDFTIDVSTHAVQYKNNFIENLANAIGFKDDDSVTIFDSKKL